MVAIYLHRIAIHGFVTINCDAWDGTNQCWVWPRNMSYFQYLSGGCSETVMTGDVIVALTLATPNKKINWIVQHGITLQQLKKAMENTHLHTDFHVKEMLTSMVRLGSQISEGKHRQYLCGLAAMPLARWSVRCSNGKKIFHSHLVGTIPRNGMMMHLVKWFNYRLYIDYI